jgi:hypothetical protein
VSKDVFEAFNTLLGWVTPSETETTKAASHRSSIKSCLEANFGMTSFFRAGSFGHGTSVSGHSDVDYFAVIPAANLKQDSSISLRQMKEALAKRFSLTDVYVDSPAVAVQFGTAKWERHEITPAYFVRATDGFNVYGIPDRYSGWMNSSPTGLNSYTNVQNERLSKKAKQLVRLVKLWNYNNNAGIRSIYIELRVSEYLSKESSIIYPIDVLRALRHMQTKELASMRDPLGLGANINPCSDALKPAALSKLNTAVARAQKAEDARNAGQASDAFGWWDKVYNGGFPAYY